MVQSHDTFGVPGVSYAFNSDTEDPNELSATGLETAVLDQFSDRVTISSDRRTLQLDLTAGLAMDPGTHPYSI